MSESDIANCLLGLSPALKEFYHNESYENFLQKTL